MPHDFSPQLYRTALDLAALADLHMQVGTREAGTTARAGWAGAGALLEVLVRDLPIERLVTRGTLGLSALTYYGHAGLDTHAQRLAVQLLQSDLEPGRRAAIASMRGSHPVERFSPVPSSMSWAVAA